MKAPFFIWKRFYSSLILYKKYFLFNDGPYPRVYKNLITGLYLYIQIIFIDKIYYDVKNLIQKLLKQINIFKKVVDILIYLCYNNYIIKKEQNL